MSSNNNSFTVPEDLLKKMMEIEPDEDIMSCQNCLYHSGRMDRFGRNCRLRSCMCIDERLSFGLVDYKELFFDLIHKFKNKAFAQRALNMIFGKKEENETIKPYLMVRESSGGSRPAPADFTTESIIY